MLLQVADIVLENIVAPSWVMQAFMLALALGFPLALFFAWAFELTPEGLKKEKDVDRTASIAPQTGRKLDYIIIGVMALALSYFIWESRFSSSESATVEEAVASAEKSIAVLPFVNMSDDPANEYFSDGIAEELLNALVKVKGLRVAARTASFAFKENKTISIPDIAQSLNVDHVLEGSVRKAGNTVRITAQLIDVRTDRHLWSGTYDRELEDIFAIQDEIAGQIVQALKIALGAGGQEAVAHFLQPTENLDSYELYLQGRSFWQRRGEDNIRRAIDLFEQATQPDPQLARAWASLAAAVVPSSGSLVSSVCIAGFPIISAGLLLRLDGGRYTPVANEGQALSRQGRSRRMRMRPRTSSMTVPPIFTRVSVSSTQRTGKSLMR